jgi:hypothetical protein
MYAPPIFGDVTVTVTGEIAKALIKSAGLGEARDDCWLLRDGTTTIVAKTALTDALVAIAEDPTETVQTPSAHQEAPASQRTSQARTTANGSSQLRDFLLTALDHDVVVDEVDQLLSEYVEPQLLSLSSIAERLRTIIYRAIGNASPKDWNWVTEALIAEACEALGIEHPLDRTHPGAETPHQPKRRTSALRKLTPDELREKLTAIYASDATSRSARRGAQLIVRHISRLTSLSREHVEADARANAEAISEMIHLAEDNPVSSEDRGSAQAAPSTSGSCWPLRRVTGSEIQELLEKGTDSTDPALRLRCGVILAVNAGASPSYLAMARHTSVEHIIRIISEFNERGLSYVEDAQ